MSLDAITLDAAGTLVQVDWHPGRVAWESAEAIGLELDRETATARFDRALHARWKAYRDLNQTRDADALDAFWYDLGVSWLAEFGSENRADAFRDAFWDALYGPNQRIFRLFEDTLPALEALKAQGIRLAVISNWDYSLHRVLRQLGITPYFEVVLASLEEGVEKPEPGLFQVAMDRLGVKPHVTLHVGDDPVDDYQGAKTFGMRAALVDRSRTAPERPYIRDLTCIPEAIAWTG